MSKANERPLVLVVDDDRDVRDLVSLWLVQEGFVVTSFEDGESCLAGLAQNLPVCICLDLHLPGMDGIDVLSRIKAHHPLVPVTMLTADSTVDTVVSAMQGGAYDYLVKPLDRPKLVATVQRAVDHHRLSVRVNQLEREAAGRGHAGLVAASAPMKRLFRVMDRVAPSDVTVLVHGESGTGKELIARGLHDASGRRDGPFVAVNCAAIPESLEASELFGHEKGAFTGAHQQRKGRIEQAHHGTLFLDEVGELSLGLQAKLLRVLQERVFQRVGGHNDVRSDFRLLAATHRDLEEEVRQGRFREDLFFRIVVFELLVPPLRERGADLDLLARHFLDRGSRHDGTSPLRLTDATRRMLYGYGWPGNVRELQNAMEHARLVASDGVVQPDDLPPRMRARIGDVSDVDLPTLTPADGVAGVPLAAEAVDVEGRSSADTDSASTVPAAVGPADGAAPPPVADSEPEPIRTLDEIERLAIEAAVARTGGNLSEVTRQLGIGRTTLYRKLKRYGIRS